jgi:anion-transporting  ArsA/GET3 family ATPase
MGPVRNQADSVMKLLQSPKTAVHLVTVLEEMPVQETADGAAELRKTGLPVGAVIVNMVRDPLLPAEDLDAVAAGKVDSANLSRGLKAAGVEADPDLLAALSAEAIDHAGRVKLEQQERKTLEGLDRPTYEIPMIADATELAGLQEIAARLQQVGMV